MKKGLILIFNMAVVLSSCGQNKNTYAASFPLDEEKYSIEALNGLDSKKIVEGSDFSFRINYKKAYSQGRNAIVKANDETLIGTENVYTVKKVQANFSITIAVEINQYELKWSKAADGISFAPIDAESLPSNVLHGGSFAFKVETTGSYSQGNNLVIKANDVTLSANKEGKYEVKDVESEQTLSASATLNQYSLTFHYGDGKKETQTGDVDKALSPSSEAVADYQKDGKTYCFIGWYDAPTEGNKVEEFPLGVAADYYAHYEAHETILIEEDFKDGEINNGNIKKVGRIAAGESSVTATIDDELYLGTYASYGDFTLRLVFAMLEGNGFGLQIGSTLLAVGYDKGFTVKLNEDEYMRRRDDSAGAVNILANHAFVSFELTHSKGVMQTTINGHDLTDEGEWQEKPKPNPDWEIGELPSGRIGIVKHEHYKSGKIGLQEMTIIPHDPHSKGGPSFEIDYSKNPGRTFFNCYQDNGEVDKNGYYTWKKDEGEVYIKGTAWWESTTYTRYNYYNYEIEMVAKMDYSKEDVEGGKARTMLLTGKQSYYGPNYSDGDCNFLLFFRLPTAGQQQFTVWRSWGGTNTDATTTTDFTTWHKYKIMGREDGTIKVYVDGNDKATLEASDVKTTGRIGLYSAKGNDFHLRSFKVANLD